MTENLMKTRKVCHVYALINRQYENQMCSTNIRLSQSERSVMSVCVCVWVGGGGGGKADIKKCGKHEKLKFDITVLKIVHVGTMGASTR